LWPRGLQARSGLEHCKATSAIVPHFPSHWQVQMLAGWRSSVGSFHGWQQLCLLFLHAFWQIWRANRRIGCT
jgi:hypothetical protein